MSALREQANKGSLREQACKGSWSLQAKRFKIVVKTVKTLKEQ